MPYLILSQPSVPYALGISRKIYELSRPPAVRHPDDVTLYYSGYLTHPVSGDVAVYFPDPGEMPVHENASDEDLPEFVKDAISVDDKKKMGQDIAAKRGKRAAPVDFLPASITDNLQTRADMEAGGWFPDPE